MVGKISRLFINELLTRTNIVDLINFRVKLKKKGKNFQAYCPFHHENIPSFTVNEEKQFYYCFGCGSHGNAIDFLMNYDNLQFVETIEELAIMHGLEIPRNINNNKFHIRNNLYKFMDKLNLFYQKMLKEQGTILVYDYLKIRGLNESIINRFSIGFAGGSVIERFGSSKENCDFLYRTGILIKNNNGNYYDRFRERIMFPIRDKQGRVIAFGGRIIGDKYPKYLNSSETEIFHKGQQLYGLYEAQKEYKKLSRLIVVEGYMDVITLSKVGINYVVALLGTSITTEHIRLLYRVTNQIFFCYDGDRAGREAAWRGLKIALPYLTDERQLRFISLPEGEDPDTLVNKIGKEEFEIYIDKAQSFTNFLFDNLLKKVDLTTQNGRLKLSKLALPLIDKVQGEMLRIYLRQNLGKKLGIIDDSQLEKFIKIRNNHCFEQHFYIKRTILRTLIGLLIQNPKLSIFVPTVHGLDKINQTGLRIFVDLLKICKIKPNLNTGQLLEFYRENNFYLQLEKLAIWNHFIADEMIEVTFIDTLIRLYDLILGKCQDTLIAYDRIYGLTPEKRKELWYLNKILAKKI